MTKSNPSYCAAISPYPSHQPESAPKYTRCRGPSTTNEPHSVLNLSNTPRPEKCREGHDVTLNAPTSTLSVQSSSVILSAGTPNPRSRFPTPNDVTQRAPAVAPTFANARTVFAPR